MDVFNYCETLQQVSFPVLYVFVILFCIAAMSGSWKEQNFNEYISLKKFGVWRGEGIFRWLVSFLIFSQIWKAIQVFRNGRTIIFR